jgi:hypothetical protein
MSARDDIARATDEARAQVASARHVLAASREAKGGGAARNAREAERQLHALRGAVVDDLRALRGRVSSTDPSARRGALTVAAAGAGAVATLVGSGLAVRGRIRQGLRQRGVERQAEAIARAMVGRALAPSDTGASRGGRRRRGALLTVLVVGAAVAGAAVLQQQRNAPVDDDDLWLPEHDLGPS